MSASGPYRDTAKEKVYDKAGQDNLTRHRGLRIFIAGLAHKGVNVRVLVALVAHKNISTTQRYIDQNEPVLRSCPAAWFNKLGLIAAFTGLCRVGRVATLQRGAALTRGCGSPHEL